MRDTLDRACWYYNAQPTPASFVSLAEIRTAESRPLVPQLLLPGKYNNENNNTFATTRQPERVIGH